MGLPLPREAQKKAVPELRRLSAGAGSFSPVRFTPPPSPPCPLSTILPCSRRIRPSDSSSFRSRLTLPRCRPRYSASSFWETCTSLVPSRSFSAHAIGNILHDEQQASGSGQTGEKHQIRSHGTVPCMPDCTEIRGGTPHSPPAVHPSCPVKNSIPRWCRATIPPSAPVSAARTPHREKSGHLWRQTAPCSVPPAICGAR